MLMFKHVPSAILATGLAFAVAGCAANGDDAVESDVSPDGVVRPSEETSHAADAVDAEDSVDDRTGSSAEALRHGAVAVVRGGGVRRGRYRGVVVTGSGGIVYGAGGVYRAGRYRTAEGVWINCDGVGNCW